MPDSLSDYMDTAYGNNATQLSAMPMSPTQPNTNPFERLLGPDWATHLSNFLSGNTVATNDQIGIQPAPQALSSGKSSGIASKMMFA